MNRKNLHGIVVPFFIACISVTGSAFLYHEHRTVVQYQTREEKDPYVRFSMEVYDAIKKNYWNSLSDHDLGTLYALVIGKMQNRTVTGTYTSRQSVSKFIADSLAESMISNEQAKKTFVTTLSDAVLNNLEPIGRSRLMSAQQEKHLRNEVANVNQQTGQVEDTTTGHLLGNVYYISIDKISPTTPRDFYARLGQATTSKSTALIVDLRGNVGGAVDVLKYFLGFFLGPNQYAYDFYHQNNFEPNKTLWPRLADFDQFRHIIVLTDKNTQSSAEVFISSLKKYHIAVVVGSNTKGWGTIENTYPISTSIDPNEQYALFLVNSLTVNEDNNPIEGRGITPNVSISEKNWQDKLTHYISETNIRASVIKALSTSPFVKQSSSVRE